MSGHFIDMGWGDWRLAESPHTRVTAAQVQTINALDGVESVGASDVRYGGEQVGELCVFHTDGSYTDVGIDGRSEHEGCQSAAVES